MSETANLNLKKHDNVSTNTNQFDIQNYMNGNWDKIDEAYQTNKTDLEKLQSKMTEVEAENARLKKDVQANQITDIVEGNSLTLAGCSNARLVDFEIKGNSYQETRNGYNLIDLDVTQNSRVTVNKDGTITINGTGGFSLNFKEITLKNGVTYYQKYELLSGTITGANSIFMGFNGSLWIPTNNYLAYTPTEDVSKSAIWINNGAVFENAKIRIWATEGEGKPFEQYGVSPSPGYPSEIKSCGDNVNLFSGIIVGYTNESGNITLNRSGYGMSDYISVFSNTEYILSNLAQNQNDIGNGYKCLNEYNENKDFIKSTYVGNYSRDTFSFTTTQETKYIVYGIYSQFVSSKTLNDYIINNKIKLEEGGTTATPYSSYNQGNINIIIANSTDISSSIYKSQIYTIPTQKPFRKIEDYIDTFVKQDGKWYEKHIIKRIVLNGSENWLFDTTKTDTQVFRLILDIGIGILSDNKIISNYFKVTGPGDIQKVLMADNQIYIAILKSIASTVAEFKAWLSEKNTEENPVYVDYVLSTPELIECTQEQTNILSEIENSESYKGLTYIYSTDEVQPNLKATYSKDLQTLITRINDAIIAEGSV